MAPLPIAHRGLWWPEQSRQNTLRAFEDAAGAGFGLELDIREAPSGLVIQHGPRDAGLPLAGDLLGAVLCAALQDRPLLAWNLKSLAAAEGLGKFLRQHGLERISVVFDHELAAWEAGISSHHGARVLEKYECPGILARASDRAREPLGYALVAAGMGVWLDAFEEDWVTAETIRTVHGAGKAAYVVSPELHGRPLDLALWAAWREAEGICTDFPHLLHALQGGAPLEPVDPWWGP